MRCGKGRRWGDRRRRLPSRLQLVPASLLRCLPFWPSRPPSLRFHLLEASFMLEYELEVLIDEALVNRDMK